MFSDADVAIYAERLKPPEQARATQLLYRGYLRVIAEVAVRRPLRGHAPAALRPGCCSASTTSRSPRRCCAATKRHADDMQVELIPDSGHFVPEEQPDLVAERALAFFG